MISIHAPLAGRDRYCGSYPNRSPYFNPRAPCGARLFAARASVCSLVFQSTRPLRGATVPPIPEPPHQPHFNPRAPCGARRQKRTNASRFFRKSPSVKAFHVCLSEKAGAISGAKLPAVLCALALRTGRPLSFRKKHHAIRVQVTPDGRCASSTVTV